MSFQVWLNPWGLSRDPEDSDKVALPPLWEKTAGMLKGNTRNTATMLSSAIASLWTAASPTTGLKSTSTYSSVFFSSSTTLIPPAGRVVWFLDSLIPSAADRFYFCESTCPEAGRYAKKVSFPSEAGFFSSTVLFAWLLIKGELEMIRCSEVLRITRLRKRPHVYSREHPTPARTGCTQSARRLDFAASSPASPGMSRSQMS